MHYRPPNAHYVCLVVRTQAHLCRHWHKVAVIISLMYPTVIFSSACSEGCPLVSCLVGIHIDYPGIGSCKVCNDAARPGSKNHRRNTAALVLPRGSDPDGPVIAIDCGKSWCVQGACCRTCVCGWVPRPLKSVTPADMAACIYEYS